MNKRKRELEIAIKKLQSSLVIADIQGRWAHAHALRFQLNMWEHELALVEREIALESIEAGLAA